MNKGVQTLSNQAKVAEWAERVSECRNSGLTVAAWCKQRGICTQTYYKWQKRLYEMATAQQQESQFAEITPAGAPLESNQGKIAVTVRVAGITADIHAGADASTVEAVLRILKLC